MHFILSMPTFDDTWLFPNTSTPPIGTGADHNHLQSFPPKSKTCCLCGNAFAADAYPVDIPTQPPCDDLSCPKYTWMWRNRDSSCPKCAARFTCPFPEQASPSSSSSSSSEIDGLPVLSSHIIAVPDDGYDGDDERGPFSISISQPLRVEHVDPRHHHDHAMKSNPMPHFETTELKGSRAPRPQRQPRSKCQDDIVLRLIRASEQEEERTVA